jgi:hypothetical protein
MNTCMYIYIYVYIIILYIQILKSSDKNICGRLTFKSFAEPPPVTAIGSNNGSHTCGDRGCGWNFWISGFMMIYLYTLKLSKMARNPSGDSSPDFYILKIPIFETCMIVVRVWLWISVQSPHVWNVFALQMCIEVLVIKIPLTALWLWLPALNFLSIACIYLKLSESSKTLWPLTTFFSL